MVIVARKPRIAAEPSVSVDDALRSYVRALRARNASVNTIKNYQVAVRQLSSSMGETSDDSFLNQLDRAAIETYLASVIATRSAATAQTRYDALKSFFRWLIEVEEIEERDNPMIGIRRPKAGIKDVELLEPTQVKRLLAACSGQDLLARRDRAIILLLWDSGVRVGGLVSMRTTRLDLDERLATIQLKGGNEHTIFFGARTASAIDRYLWARRAHPLSGKEDLWLGKQGRLTASGVAQMLVVRAAHAKLGCNVHPHMFRHSHVDAWLSSEGGEEALITHMGWTSGKQLARYGRIRRVARARDAHRKLSPGDRL